MSQLLKNPTDVTPITGSESIDDGTMKVLQGIVGERYKMSFDRSRLTSASDLHREAKRLLETDMDYA